MITMRTFKGLEYCYTTVVGVNDRALRNPSAITPEEVDRLQQEADLAAERCLLFAACTRARGGLSSTSRGPGSRARAWWMLAAGHGSGHSLLTVTKASKRKHLQAVSRYFHFHGKL